MFFDKSFIKNCVYFDVQQNKMDTNCHSFAYHKHKIAKIVVRHISNGRIHTMLENFAQNDVLNYSNTGKFPLL